MGAVEQAGPQVRLELADPAAYRDARDAELQFVQSGAALRPEFTRYDFETLGRG